MDVALSVVLLYYVISLQDILRGKYSASLKVDHDIYSLQTVGQMLLGQTSLAFHCQKISEQQLSRKTAVELLPCLIF